MGCSSGPDVVEDGLVLCLDAGSKRSYPGTGTTWTDTVGGNNGTLTNMDGANFSSDNGGSLSFDASNERIRIINDSSLQFGTGSFSAFAWIYPQNVNNCRIINNRGAGLGGYYKGYQLKISQSGSAWHFSDTGIDDASGNYKAITSNKYYPKSKWHHVNMVYKQDHSLILYVNGVLDSVLAVGAYGDITNSLPTAVGSSISADGVESGSSQFYGGKMSQVGLYKRALSADEVRKNYLSTKERYQ